MYIKNKHKRDQRIASRREAKQVKSLFNSISRESQHLNNVLNLAKIFVDNNPNLDTRDESLHRIINSISSDIAPFPLSKACKEHGVKLLKDYINNPKKKKNV